MASQTRTIVPRAGGWASAAPWPSLPAPTAPRPGSNFQNITTAPSQPSASHRRFCISHLTASPQPTLQPEATRMGSCPIQNPLGVPRDLRIRPQVPYHGLKGSRGPAPTSGLPGSPSESFSCGHPGCLGAFAHTGGPIAAGASSASSFQAPRFLLTNTLHFPAFGAGPTVCRRRPVPSRAARQRPNQPVEGEQLPAVPATAPTFPTGPKTRAAGDPLLGPRRSAPPM